MTFIQFLDARFRRMLAESEGAAGAGESNGATAAVEPAAPAAESTRVPISIEGDLGGKPINVAAHARVKLR